MGAFLPSAAQTAPWALSGGHPALAHGPGSILIPPEVLVQNSVHPWSTGQLPEPLPGAMALLVAVLLLLLALAGHSQRPCSPTAFYKNCWIRRFPGLRVDLRESQSRGARLLRGYAEISARQCSRACCLLRNGECLLVTSWHAWNPAVLGNGYVNSPSSPQEEIEEDLEIFFWGRKAEVHCNSCPKLRSHRKEIDNLYFFRRLHIKILGSALKFWISVTKLVGKANIKRVTLQCSSPSIVENKQWQWFQQHSLHGVWHQTRTWWEGKWRGHTVCPLKYRNIQCPWRKPSLVLCLHHVSGANQVTIKLQQ